MDADAWYGDLHNLRHATGWGRHKWLRYVHRIGCAMMMLAGLGYLRKGEIEAVLVTQPRGRVIFRSSKC